MPATGNSEVVELLEYWLQQARGGDLFYMALAAVKDRDQVAYDYAGVKGLEDRAQTSLRTLTLELDALRDLTGELEGLRQGRNLGPRNFDLSASHVEYHLTGTPICWDFLIWLVDAEMTRRRLGGPAPLRVAFTRADQLDTPSRSFFENVFRPLLPLIGAVEDEAAQGGRHKPVYVPMDICLAARSGEAVPRLAASAKGRETMALWLHDTVPVTITLREASHWQHRNSNLDAWLKFAADLERRGEKVIFIRDTEKAIDPLPGFATCPIAAFNVDLRMALYEKAKVNLFVSNGPAGLALFGDRPYLYFLHINKRDHYGPNKPGWWRMSNGVVEGDQWPWALPTQRMIWQPDTYENISVAWEQHKGNGNV